MSLPTRTLLVALLVSSCKKGDPVPEVDWCSDLLACAIAQEDWHLAEFEEEFGPAGTCWSTSSAVACQNQCEVAYAELPWMDHPACPNKVPSEDCEVLLHGPELCAEFPEYMVPDLCGHLPDREACMADAVEICDEQLLNRMLACSFEL